MNLSLDAINNHSPYAVQKIDESTYTFTTKSGIVYCVGFVRDESFMSEGAYQFFINNTSGKNAPQDMNVSKTIQALIVEFFNHEPVVMLYICDTKDEKQAVRNRLFRIWFEAYVSHAEFSMYNEQIEFEGVVYFASVLLKKDHPLHNEVIANFHDFIFSLPEKFAGNED